MRATNITLLAVVATAEAAAAGPVLQPLAPCYVSAHSARGGYSTEPVSFTGTGFTPGAVVVVSVNGTAVGDRLTADPSGAVAGTVPAPGVRRGQRTFTLAATERDRPEHNASVFSAVSDLTARMRPRSTPPGHRVRFSGRGFTDTTAALYAHYTRAGQTRTVRLAGPSDHPCGAFSVRRRQFPFRPRPGRWTIRIDQSERAHATTPAVEIGVRVRRVRA